MNVNTQYRKESEKGAYRRPHTQTHGRMGTVLCSSVLRVLRLSRWCVGATQRGGGVDHPTKVQQKKAQTEIALFRTLLFSPTLSISAHHCASLVVLSLICTLFHVSGYTFFLICALIMCFGYIIEPPLVLPTLESNLANYNSHFIVTAGGISYPFSIID